MTAGTWTGGTTHDRGAAAFFAGPGEMRERCRGFDWAATPLGPVAGWPPALRTAAQLVLDAGLPNILLWGPGLTQIYNDAYARIIRAKHPFALGRGNEEAWPEVWHINGPIFERVLAGETVTNEDAHYPLLREGAEGAWVESDAWLTVSFSPVRDERGLVGGVLANMIETTGEVAYRRLEAERVRLVATERAAHAEARAAREHLERVISQAPVSMYIARGREHVYEVVDGAWCQIVRRRPEEVVGRSVREAFPEVGRQGIYDLVERVYDTGQPAVFPAQRVRLDYGRGPEERFFNIVYQPLRDAAGAVYAMAVVATDVTELARARRDAEAAERRVALMAAASGALAESLDPEAVLRTVARLAVGTADAPGLADGCVITLATPEEAAQGRFRHVVESIDPEKAALEHDRLRRFPAPPDAPHGFPAVIRTGCAELVTPEALDAAVGASLGADPEQLALFRRLELHSSLCVPLVARGRVLGAITLARHGPRRRAPLDDADLALAEELARRAAVALDNARLHLVAETERERLARVVAQVPRAVGVLQGPAPVFIAASEAYRRMAGGRPLIGRPDAEIFPELVEQGFVALLDRVYATGEPFRGSDVPVRWDEDGDGVPEDHLVDFAYQPLRTADGRVEGIVFEVTDVTTRSQLFAAEREARAAAERARGEAEAANRAKADFLATMSHELRTPLNAIGGYAELMELGLRGPVTEQQRVDLARIQASQRHLLGLINEVLNYAKLESGAVRYVVEDVPLAEAAREAEALIAPQARAKGLALRVRDCQAAVVARADAEKVRQILVNLLTNAVKFTDRGGTIEVGCAAPSSGAAAVWVRDTGIGIPADKLTAIFEPFVQVRADLTRTAEGTGLGLAISRDLARGMGGDLTAESRPGAGSAFTLTLPRG